MVLGLYQEVALRHDFPEHQLQRGAIAVLIDTVPYPTDGEPVYMLEVFSAVGESIRVVAVPQAAVAPLRVDQVLAVRELA